jgi:hypothetical protein
MLPGSYIVHPDHLLDFKTCKEVDRLAREGRVDPNACQGYHLNAPNQCGCSDTPSAVLTLTPTDSAATENLVSSPPVDPNIITSAATTINDVCNICDYDAGQIMMNPSQVIDPSGERCAYIDWKGKNQLLTSAECADYKVSSILTSSIDVS